MGSPRISTGNPSQLPSTPSNSHSCSDKSTYGGWKSHKTIVKCVSREYQANKPKRCRSLTSQSCVRCRRQKIKCSGSQPCDGCSKRKLSCVFNDRDQKILVTRGSVNCGCQKFRWLSLAAGTFWSYSKRLRVWNRMKKIKQAPLARITRVKQLVCCLLLSGDPR